MKLLSRSSMFYNVLSYRRTLDIVRTRPIKNFGHKRQPIPLVTTIWHGFLTFTFMGLLLEWDKILKFIFGDTKEDKNMLEQSIVSDNKI